MERKPLVWYVDDLPENLEKFRQNHANAFTVRTFETPGQVLDALSNSKPDALLCDIFFYEDVQTAREMEVKVGKKAEEIREFGEEIGANKLANQGGIKLLQEVANFYKHQFPIYAYTSKGPYILDAIGFDHIGETGALWLFKSKYGPHTEQVIIQHDIEEFRLKNSFTMRIARFFWLALFGSGFLGGLVVWFLTEEAIEPTTPAAPCTRTLCPTRRRPCSNSPCHAVRPDITRAAPTVKSTSPGSGARLRASTATYSASVPSRVQSVRPNTRCPTDSPVVP